MSAPFCILRLRPSRASGKHAPASRQCQPRHFCAVSGRQPAACAAQAGKSADMAEKSIQKIYGIIVFRHVDLSRELALRQDKPREVRRSRRQRHRRVRHKIDDPVRDRTRDLQDLHVQPQQHFHIRNDRHAEALRDVFGSGAARAICGSIAVTQPDAFREWLAEFGSAKMILGADTRDGRIAINGWLEAATVGVEELIGSFRDAGLSQVICTDIAKDGMLSGPSVPLYLQLQKTFPEIDITVSGGISSWEDIEELDRNGLRSVVVGKAIYEGRIRFEQLEKYMLTVRTDKKQQRC